MSVRTIVDQRGVIQERVFVDGTAQESNLTVNVPAYDSQGFRLSSTGFAKKILNVQLDAPPSAIAPSGSHIYNIDLGKPYTHILLTGFQWLSAPVFRTSPDPVFASAVFPRSVHGGVLHVTNKPKGWVRGFSLATPEYQNGSPTIVSSEFYSTSQEVSGALGYGMSTGQTFLNHPSVNTNPPAKLQVEDAYIDGQILKITIKNYGSSSIDLTGFIGATILENYTQASAMGSINDNGVMVYAQGAGAGGSGNGDSVVASTNAGASWFTLLEEGPWNAPAIAGITATNDSVNNFVALVNYQYVWTASDSDWTLRPKAVIGSAADNHYMSFAIGPGSTAFGSSNIRGHLIDWHKPSSTGLFISLFNYSSVPEQKIWGTTFGGGGVSRMKEVAVFKTIDDFENYGGNHPLYNDKQPLASGSGLVADFKYQPTIVNGNVDLTNMQAKVVDDQTYYVKFPYIGDPETYAPLNSTNRVRTNPFLGTQNLVFDPNITWTLDPRSIAYDTTVNMTSEEAPTGVVIAGSTSGNNGIRTIVSEQVTHNVYPSFIGPGSWTSDPGGPNEQTLTLLASEIAIQKSLASFKPLPGGDAEIIYPPSATTVYTIAEVREATVYNKEFYVVNLANRYDGTSFYVALQALIGGPLAGSPEGETINNHTFRWYQQPSYLIPYNSKNYRIFVAKSTEPAFTPEAMSAGTATFAMYESCLKQALLKTTDGGSTWTEIMTHDDFKYANQAIFASSNDGQTLLLSTMKYWATPARDKFPYFDNVEGNYPYFNMSEDGGATWKYTSGNWKQIPYISYGFNFVNGAPGQPDRSYAGQVLGKVDDEILGVFIRHSQNNKNPFVVKSTDDGATWSLQLEKTVGGSLAAWASDSRDQFLAFFSYYQPSIPLVIYGTVIDSYTNWQAYAERSPAGL